MQVLGVHPTGSRAAVQAAEQVGEAVTQLTGRVLAVMALWEWQKDCQWLMDSYCPHRGRSFGALPQY